MYESTDQLEIIIIDNFSNDNSRAIITELTKKYNFIGSVYTDSLVSFSAANNTGIKMSKGENILIMNPDIIFTEPVLEKLISQFQKNKKIGAISPALMGTNGKFQRNYFQRYPTTRQFIYYHSIFAPLFNKSAARMNRFLENQEIDTSQNKTFHVEQIPCAFFLTTKIIVGEVGLMDENYVLFFEDVDLSYSINKNHILAVDTSLKVTHLGGSSFKSDENWWLYGRFIFSMHYFFRKNYSASKAALLKMLIKLNSIFILLLEKFKGIFGKKDDYRYKKHEYLLKLMREKT
jgi:GT2 family glycosyltransferase